MSIILRQCAWRETPLGAIQALPPGGAPIESYPDPEVGWRDVVTAFERLLGGRSVGGLQRAPVVAGELDPNLEPPAKHRNGIDALVVSAKADRIYPLMRPYLEALA